jgi:hypothetical protein
LRAPTSFCCIGTDIGGSTWAGSGATSSERDASRSVARRRVGGLGTDYGIYGAGGTYGLYAAGSGYGVVGYGPTGIYGSGSTYGVVGTTVDPNADAVRGDGGQYGVHGINSRTAGIRGDSNYVGAWAQGASYGVYGLATAGTGTTYGLFGQASNGSSYALWAQGNAAIASTLSKSAGSFKIDHPLEPEHKWLSHQFVESPDMLNVYNGSVDLDPDGAATVQLPDYFGALNRDVRYQLTAIGGPAPSLHVAREVKDNAFRIAGGTSGGRVSWQVTGIRQDDYAKANPIVVETPKTGDERGARMFVPEGSNASHYLPTPARPRSGIEPTPTPAPKHVHPAID